jgi:hypothetical protein
LGRAERIFSWFNTITVINLQPFSANSISLGFIYIAHFFYLSIIITIIPIFVKREILPIPITLLAVFAMAGIGAYLWRRGTGNQFSWEITRDKWVRIVIGSALAVITIEIPLAIGHGSVPSKIVALIALWSIGIGIYGLMSLRVKNAGATGVALFLKPYVIMSIVIAAGSVIAWLLANFEIYSLHQAYATFGINEDFTGNAGRNQYAMPLKLGLVLVNEGLPPVFGFDIFRASALSPEPSSAALFLAPSIFLIPSVFPSLSFNKRIGLMMIVIAAIITTFSISALLALAITSLAWVLRSRPRLAIILAVLVVIGVLSLYLVARSVGDGDVLTAGDARGAGLFVQKASQLPDRVKDILWMPTSIFGYGALSATGTPSNGLLPLVAIILFFGSLGLFALRASLSSGIVGQSGLALLYFVVLSLKSPSSTLLYPMLVFLMSITLILWAESKQPALPKFSFIKKANA